MPLYLSVPRAAQLQGIISTIIWAKENVNPQNNLKETLTELTGFALPLAVQACHSHSLRLHAPQSQTLSTALGLSAEDGWKQTRSLH